MKARGMKVRTLLKHCEMMFDLKLQVGEINLDFEQSEIACEMTQAEMKFWTNAFVVSQFF